MFQSQSRYKAVRFHRIISTVALGIITFFSVGLHATTSEAQEVTVNLNTGNPSYRIPIEVPPGNAGHTPSLALVYGGRPEL